MSSRERIGAVVSVATPSLLLAEIHGKPALHHLLERVFASWYVDREQVVVSVSDDRLSEAAAAQGAQVFQSEERDAARRLAAAARGHGFDLVLAIDGEDVLCDTLYMDLVLERLLSDDTIGLVECGGLPPGTAPRSLSAEAIGQIAAARGPAGDAATGLNGVDLAALCRNTVVRPLTDRHVLDGARLSLGAEADLAVLRPLFEALYKLGEVFGLGEIVAFLRAHPEVAAIAAGAERTNWARARREA